MTLNELLHNNQVTLDQIQKHLAALSPEERVRQSTTLDRSCLAVLWRASEKSEPVKDSDFVPVGHKPLNPIPFEGQNNLPAFRSFKKVFYRTNSGKIAGYNDQAMGWLTGPGYYIVKQGAPNAFIDYTEIPTEKPDGWPAIKKNEAGISNLVYGHMQDHMRRAYGSIFIGRATKKGKDMENYFVLARG